MEPKPNILLVDDQPDLLDNLSLTLEMAGYRTLVAKHGIEALQHLKTSPISLILSDIDMPQMGGYQLYHTVRENPDWRTIPFLILTGCRFISEGEIRYGKTLGIEEYLVKPIRSKDLIEAVQRTLHRTDEEIRCSV